MIDAVSSSSSRRRAASMRSAPVAVQERLIAGIAALPAVKRHTLAVALSAIARLVTPAGAAPFPPMLFEDGARNRRRPLRVGGAAGRQR